MKKKRIIIISLSIVIVIIFVVLIFNYISLINKTNNLNEELNSCKRDLYTTKKYKEAEKCFLKILNATNKPDYKYYHAVCLFNLMEFDKAKVEFKEIIDNQNKIKNKKIIEKSKKLYKFLSSITEKSLIDYLTYDEIDEENLKRLDVGNYYSDLDKTTTWKHPEKIKVFVEINDCTLIQKKAFAIWDKALDNTVNFVFTRNEDDADIVCDCKYKLDNNQLGKTKTKSKKDKETGKKYLYKANIKVATHDPVEGKEISDNDILSTTLHEIGHALGIISHSPQKGDIMYFDSSSYKQDKAEVSNRDVNTVKKIYGNI